MPFSIDPTVPQNQSSAIDKLPSPGPTNKPRAAKAAAGRGGGGEGNESDRMHTPRFRESTGIRWQAGKRLVDSRNQANGENG